MRVAQLARKLELRPGEIAEFLITHGIPVYEGSNTRLENTHVALIIEKLAPGKMEMITGLTAQTETDLEQATDFPEQEIQQPESVALETPAVMEVISSETIEQPVLTFQPEPEIELGDVIKAPKVELPGLKVLGKIELPEPKKKEQLPVETTDAQQTADSPAPEKEKKKPYREDRRNRDNDNRKRHERPRKNPVTLERERQAREEEIKKEQEAKLAKERRTQNYLKKIKTVAPTRSARLIEEPVMNMEEAFAETRRSNSLWGRFMKWLRRD